MTLTVTVPTERVFEREVIEVIAESPGGSFCLLPRHRDVATLLVPGLLLAYVDGAENGDETRGGEITLAVDEGSLVKCGAEVRVACRRAVVAGDLAAARATVRREFRVRGERERRARTALRRLESDIVRRLSELGGRRV